MVSCAPLVVAGVLVVLLVGVLVSVSVVPPLLQPANVNIETPHESKNSFFNISNS
jgi:hypothetical protein